ncbi:unnamed protein product [Vicia faba]|uniref:Uncharacterized protein n=1 Tax=Vicia faba TaxID=3906 RepID=A0AAV0ZT83_VICFA|nr:unnamed protein product [Vicia faba]
MAQRPNGMIHESVFVIQRLHLTSTRLISPSRIHSFDSSHRHHLLRRNSAADPGFNASTFITRAMSINDSFFSACFPLTTTSHHLASFLTTDSFSFRFKRDSSFTATSHLNQFANSTFAPSALRFRSELYFSVEAKKFQRILERTLKLL